MPANDNVTVRIVGDASGVQPAVEQARGSIGNLEPLLAQLNSQMAALTAQMREGFMKGSAAAEGMTSTLRGTKAATEAEGNALVGMVMKVHEGAEAMRTFQMRAKAFAEVYVGIFAVESVAHWAEALGAAAEKTEQLAAKLGMTVPQVQALSGAATMSGTNMDTLGKALGMMDNRAVTAAGHTSTAGKAFQAMGIDARDGSTNMQRLLTIADKFQGMADGPTKAALAMQLFGRSGREMIPFLNQGSVAIEQLMQKTKDLGAVNEAAVEQGARLASSVNESKVAWEGLKQTLTEAFGPILTELVDGFIGLVKAMHDSYESGGAVKVIFDAIAEVVGAVIDIVHAVAITFTEMFAGTSSGAFSWSAAIKDVISAIVIAFKLLMLAAVAVKDGILAALYLIDAGFYALAAKIKEFVEEIKAQGAILGAFMQVVGRVCEDALMLHWGRIASDWNAGMANVKAVVQQKANEIAQTTAALRKHVQDDMAAISGIGNSFGDFFTKVTKPYAPAHDDFKFKFGGGGGDAPDITSPGKGSKGKQGPSVAEQLEAELEAKKTAWAMEQDAQGTYQQYSLQSEADFWAQALQRTNLGTKDKLAIEKKYLAARAALKQDEIAQVLDGYQQQLELAGQNWTAKLQILEKERAYVVQMYGAESKEARKANEAVLKAEQEKKKQLQEIDQQIAQGKRDAALAAIDAQQAAAESEVEMGRMTKTQLLTLEKKFENDRFEIQRSALSKRLELMKLDPGMDPVKLQQIQQQIEALERQHQAKLTDIDRKAQLQRTQIQRQAIQNIASGWANALGQMLTLQQGFTATLKSLWQTVQQTIGSAIASIIQDWLTKQLSALILGKAQKLAEATGEIAANAAVAASGAYAATAAIPIVGPELAPAAAAAAYGGAMSWMGALSASAAEKGDWNVREGLYHLHESEMVLPSWAAQGLRGMIGSGTSPAANFNAPSPANDGGRNNGGHTFIFNGPTTPAQMERWFKDNWRALGAGAKQFHRNGGLSNA